MGSVSQDLKTRLVRKEDGGSSLAVYSKEEFVHLRTNGRFGAIISQVKDKVNREVTVTTAKNAAATMTTVITSTNDAIEKSITTSYVGGFVTRIDTFHVTAGGVDRRTEWAYKGVASAIAKYENNGRVMEVHGIDGRRSIFETSGQRTGNSYEVVTKSRDGKSAYLPGGAVINPGNEIGIYDPSGQGNKTRREYTTFEGGRRREGYETTGDRGGVYESEGSYTIFDENNRKIGGGSGSASYDPSTGKGHAGGQDYGQGSVTSSITDTDGQGGITTHTISSNPDGSSQESTWTTNPDGSSSRTVTTKDSSGNTTVDTTDTDKNGNETNKTETYNSQGEKTSESEGGGNGDDPNKQENPDKSGTGYPNPEGTDSPPRPDWRGPADAVFTEYLNGLNAFMGANVLSSRTTSRFESVGYTPPPFANVAAAMTRDVGVVGRELAAGVAVSVDALRNGLNPGTLLGSLTRLSVVPATGGAFAAAQKAAGVLTVRT